MYEDFLRLDLPAGTSIIDFANDALVCAAEDVRILEVRINESLWQAKRLLDSRGLKMAPEKTEVLLVTNRRSFQYPRIVLGEDKVEWKTSIKYLEVHLDRRLSFAEYLQIATTRSSNLEQTWLGSCPILVDPGKQREDCWRAWCIRSNLMQLLSRLEPYKTMHYVYKRFCHFCSSQKKIPLAKKKY